MCKIATLTILFVYIYRIYKAIGGAARGGIGLGTGTVSAMGMGPALGLASDLIMDLYSRHRYHHRHHLFSSDEQEYHYLSYVKIKINKGLFVL